jgi:putative ABC transport system ATP-binding protein
MVLKFLQDLNKEGHTVIMVTHEQEAAEFARRIVRLRDGQIVFDEKNGNVRREDFNK